jgi:hypothetical protein
VVLDGVHGGHGEAGAVDEAADVAFELDEVEACGFGFDLGGVFLGGVVEGLEVLVAEEGVGVELELGVDGDELAVGVVLGGGVMTRGLISASEQSFFSKRAAREDMSLTAWEICLPLRPRSKAMRRASCGWRPMRGWRGSLMILSGVLSATSSISTPPSELAMRTLRRVARSVVMAR